MILNWMQLGRVMEWGWGRFEMMHTSISISEYTYRTFQQEKASFVGFVSTLSKDFKIIVIPAY
jgi:hypothetical protein